MKFKNIFDKLGKMVLDIFFFKKNPKFVFFSVQSAPVQHPFMVELENRFKNKSMDYEIAFDDKIISPMFQFANIVHDKPINDKHGHKTTERVLNNTKHKSVLEKYVIYEMRTQRGAIVPAMTWIGLKEFLSMLSGDFAEGYRAYEHHLSTLIEGSDRDSINNLMDANEASSNVLNKIARHYVAQDRAAGGPSLAAPPEQVLAARG